MANGYGQKDCPVARALDVVGEKWSLLILRDLFRAKARYAFSSLKQGSREWRRTRYRRG